MRSIRTTNRRARRRPWFPRHREFTQWISGGGSLPDPGAHEVWQSGWTGMFSEASIGADLTVTEVDGRSYLHYGKRCAPSLVFPDGNMQTEMLPPGTHVIQAALS